MRFDFLPLCFSLLFWLFVMREKEDSFVSPFRMYRSISCFSSNFRGHFLFFVNFTSTFPKIFFKKICISKRSIYLCRRCITINFGSKLLGFGVTVERRISISVQVNFDRKLKISVFFFNFFFEFPATFPRLFHTKSSRNRKISMSRCDLVPDLRKSE